uniref:Uncharacterized protein n=1 Tax=Odontella aurita TaxID=265563 RepID=A0A7S4MM42_9STRA|mmetsp:Transcript_25467/g.75010  ORF Transcript_25467/g.75010 Transcript_25467/m.75010 type:complete len:120 (+) Transcript_25467:692-1051(+)
MACTRAQALVRVGVASSGVGLRLNVQCPLLLDPNLFLTQKVESSLSFRRSLCIRSLLPHPFDPIPIHVTPNRKGAKKVAKLEAQIPYHQGRDEKDEVEKIKEKVIAIRKKEMEAQGFVE